MMIGLEYGGDMVMIGFVYMLVIGYSDKSW